ncbi:MAG: hypothetical protein R2684_04575 [Pyrinomonadaceae bacterium]
MTKYSIVEYREFYDVPRVLLLFSEACLLLLDCQFDDEADDYPHSYEVYLMPRDFDWSGLSNWYGIEANAIRKIGTLGLDQIEFDETKRKHIKSRALDALCSGDL